MIRITPMTDATITLKSRDATHSADSAHIRRLPFTIQHIFTPEGAGYDFAWSGASAYLALHDMVLADARLEGDDIVPTTTLDVRDRMTFLPRGVRVQGWGEPGRRGNSFTALYFDQDWLLDELEVAPKNRSLQSSIYFQNKSLLQSMAKLGRLAREPTPAPRIIVDSLAIMVGADLMRAGVTQGASRGGLTSVQRDALRDFVQAHLAEDISLGDLAAVAGQSVFHFTRQFKKSTGTTPYQYVLEARIERAKHIMRDTALPLSTVAQMVGFRSASRFSRAFSGIAGVTPREFRDAHS